jgi:hypothetical protein
VRPLARARFEPHGPRQIIALDVVGLRDIPDRHPVGEFGVVVLAPVDRMDDQPDREEQGDEQCKRESDEQRAVLSPQLTDPASTPKSGGHGRSPV